ncbi:MAG: DUF948 domain-containing protein [Candidatus Sericytochromatia bacterium]|nr:DUF948 domain-containing protein [Candidatus Sericytochromatia bacterium]
MITSTFSTWHILAIILAIGFSVLVFFVAKLLMQLQNTLKVAEITLGEFKKDLEPVINNVEVITGNVEQMTGRADDIFKDVKEKTDEAIATVDNLKGNLNVSQDVIKHTFYLFLSRSAKYSKAFSTGLKTGVENFKDNKVSVNYPFVTSISTPKVIDHLKLKANK